ncbi:MAG: NAD(P)/FAD-dependent oxidoreductase [Desulfobacterium sp.]|nr:NAD(P)/FAD-dependent oxidoreductase [Desulfobacterium sp.]
METAANKALIKNNINERIPQSDRTRVVIIGGGFAGIELVKKLGKIDVQVILVDKHNYHTFIPLLYQVATAGLNPGDICIPLRDFMRDYKHFHFRMAKVERVDALNKEIITDIGVLDYDILVIASGSRTNFFGNKQIKKNASNLREITDAIELRIKLINNFEEALQVNDESDLEKHMNIVIVGAGPIGVELAGAICELRRHVLPKDYPELDFTKMNIIMINKGKQVLGAMSQKAGAKAAGYLYNLGVRIRLETFLKSYEDGIAVLSDGTEIKTNCLIWAAGVHGSLIPGLNENVVINGRMKVDKYNLIYGHKHIYAVGDAALQHDGRFPKGLPMLATVAIQQANNLGANIGNLQQGRRLKPFKYVDMGTMATIGRNKAVIDLPFNLTIGGFFAWVIWMFIHLFSIAGFRRKLLVFSNWMWNYVTYSQGNRLIIKKDVDD